MDDHEPRPSLRVYVVFVALIAAVSGAALVLLGGQTSMILSTISGAV
jgi:hypothetical protein